MPAYNAAATLRRTYEEVMAQGIVDLVIVVDDASNDRTTAIARSLPQTFVYTHPKNEGYGADRRHVADNCRPGQPWYGAKQLTAGLLQL